MKSSRKSDSKLSTFIINVRRSTAGFVASAPVWLKASTLTLLYAFLLLSFGSYVSQIIPDNPMYINAISYHYDHHVLDSANLLSHWDTPLYTGIVQHGYDNLTVAFFPLYPLAGSVIANLTGLDTTVALMFVSLVSSISLSIVLYYWAKFEFETRKIKTSPWLLLGLVAMFPTALYLFVPYSESLFMLLTTGALFSYRKGNYWIATLLSFLSATARPQGVLIGLYFILDYLFAKDWRAWKKLLPIAGASIGIVLYMIYLWHAFGNPLAFLTAQQYWGRFSDNPLKVFMWSFNKFFLWYLPVLFMGLYFVRRHLDKPLFWYSVVFMVLPLASGSLQSLNRYMLACLPLFLATAIAWAKLKPTWRSAYVFSCGILLAVNIILFFNNYWVA